MSRRTLLLGLSFLAFISIGLPDGLLGVAWPSVRAYFDLPLDALGSLLIVSTTGYVVSSFSSGRILSRMNVGVLLALSCLATAVSLLGYAGAPHWWVMVTFASLAGLGAGAIDAGLNTYVATNHSARTLNFLHSFYGVGTAAGPAIMSAVLASAQPWQRGYALVGAGQILLAVCFAATVRLWPATAESRTGAVAATNTETLRLPIIWVSMAAFFVYTGLEAGFGAWTYTLLYQGRGLSMGTAAFWVSAFWGGLTLGRLGFAFFGGRAMSLANALRGCMLGIAFGSGLLWLAPTPFLGGLGVAIAGITCGPVFPSLIATTPSRVGEEHTTNAVGFEVSAAAVGQSLIPALVGVLADSYGLEYVGAALFACAAALLTLHPTLFRSPAAEASVAIGAH